MLALVTSRKRTIGLMGIGLMLALCLAISIRVAVAGSLTGARQATKSSMVATAAAGQLSAVATFPDLPVAALQNSRLPGSIDNDRQLLLGGVGSDLWRSPADPPGEFWMVTDRGPNDSLKVDGETRRTFAVPEYTPLILHVRMDGSAISVLDTIPIVGQSGQPVTGLPNVEGHEAPYDASGQVRLPMNPSGLDVEGLIRTPSDEFWAVEEYGPSLVHIDGNGKVLRRFVPEGSLIQDADYPVEATLPSIFNLRTPNRGFEGLTLSPDGRTLYLAIQSPLSNPDAKTAGRSRVVRIVAFDIATARVTAEYAYPTGWIAEAGSDAKPVKAPKPERVAKPGQVARPEKPARPPKPDTEQTRISGLAPVGSSQLLVLERTSEDARLYLIDLNGAANMIGTRWDDPATTPSLEALVDPSVGGVTLLAKTLQADLSAIPELPEKIEGVAIIDASTVAVANDNDFDIGTIDQAGNNVGSGLKSQILMVKLPLPLP